MVIFGLEFFKRLRFRLTVGYWCRHYTWTPWERVNDYGLCMQQCESCGIRRTR